MTCGCSIHEDRLILASMTRSMPSTTDDSGISRQLIIILKKQRPEPQRDVSGRRWTEMGSFDITASIDYVLNATKTEKLSLVGHSLGCALSYIAMLENPQYNDKIDVMISLAPSTNFQNSNSIFRILSPFAHSLQVTIIKK